MATELESAVKAPEEQIIDIQMVNPKKKFRINGDNSKIVELNVSDVNIAIRLKEVYKKLDSMAHKAGSLLVNQEGASTEEELEAVSKALTDLDTEMRNLVNYLFDYDVCSVCANGMNLYSLVNGEFWFEHVIESLAGLYETNFKNEFSKMSARIHKHTDKYTGK